MTFETAFIFAMSLALLWIKPGPNQVFKVARALNDGFWPAFYFVLGVIAACIIFFLVTIYGLSYISQFFEKASFFFKIIGAAYLFHIAAKTLLNLNKGTWNPAKNHTHKKKFIQNFPPALMLTLGNPFPIFFFLGLLPTLIPLGEFTTYDIIIGITIIVAVGLTVDTLLILLVSQIKEALSNPNLVKRINLISGLCFVGLGLLLLYSAFFLDNFTFDLF